MWFNAFAGRMYRDACASPFFHEWMSGVLYKLMNQGSRPGYIDEFQVQNLRCARVCMHAHLCLPCHTYHHAVIQAWVSPHGANGQESPLPFPTGPSGCSALPPSIFQKNNPLLSGRFGAMPPMLKNVRWVPTSALEDADPKYDVAMVADMSSAVRLCRCRTCMCSRVRVCLCLRLYACMLTINRPCSLRQAPPSTHPPLPHTHRVASASRPPPSCT